MALNQAIRNANDGISVLQIADGALSQVTDLLWRATTLAEESVSDVISTQGKDALNAEFTAIKDEIDRIARDTNFNGQALFGTNVFSAVSNGSNLDVFVGDLTRTSSYISVAISSLGSSGTANGGLNLAAALTGSAGVDALTQIKAALNTVAIKRGDIGAGMNRLQAAINVIQTQSQNTLSAESTIRDANVAEEITNMTKFQILAQTGIAALAQANANSQNVLNLLR